MWSIILKETIVRIGMLAAEFTVEATVVEAVVF
jgi:hypothetical protein